MRLAEIRIKRYCTSSGQGQSQQPTGLGSSTAQPVSPFGGATTATTGTASGGSLGQDTIQEEWVGKNYDKEQQLTTWVLRITGPGVGRVEAEGYSNGIYFDCGADLQLLEESDDRIGYRVVSGNCGLQLKKTGHLRRIRSKLRLRVCCNLIAGDYDVNLKRSKK